MSFKIAHCSDIHIRSLARHDEFRITFQEFIDDCKLNKVDAIFVGGDIFHTKTIGISPEYIDLLSWWLTEMSSVATVYLILGNHDGNLVNSTRQDAVSPIVSALNNPKIILFKNSGVFPISENINLCVFSVFDESNWNIVKPEKGKINIAAYHGPVVGSLTELNFELDHGLNSSFFKDFHFTLLGDIHKRQHLELRNGKPVMSYPGSLLQLTYAEEISHGYLLWDIKDENKWDVNYRELKNHKPFVTIDWNDSFEEFKSECFNRFSKKSRFRVRSKIHISHNNSQKIISFLRNEFDATEVTFKIDQYNDKSISEINKENYNIQKSILRSEETLLGMLKSYHKNIEVSDETWADVKDSIREYLDFLKSEEDQVRNVKWSLKEFSFDNLFSYGAGNYINFENMNGIVGIFGRNRAGKSSIVGGLMYTLFNSTDRGSIKNLHICNTRKPFCYSKLKIAVNGRDYIIERQISKKETKKGTVNAITSLNLFKELPDGTLHDLVGEQRTNTEKEIRKLIGTSEDFLLTSLSAQGEINQFIQQGSTKRRQILTKFLDLDIFSKLLDLSNKSSNVLKSQLKMFPELCWDEEIEKKEKKKLLLSENITKSKEKTNFLNVELFDLRNEMSSLKNANSFLASQSEVDSLKQKFSTLELKTKKIETLIRDNSDLLRKNSEKLESIETVFRENSIDTLKEKVSAYKSLELTLNDLKHSFEKEKLLLERQKKSVSILNTVPCGDAFPSCRFIKEAHETKLKVNPQEILTDEILEKLEKTKESLELLKKDNPEEKLLKLEKLKNLKSSILVENSRLDSQIKLEQSELLSLNKEKELTNEKILSIEKFLNDGVCHEAQSLRQKIDEVEKELKKLENERISFSSEEGKVSSEIERLKSDKEKKNELLRDLENKGLISSAFNKKGIPSEIIKSQIPLINKEISNILSDIVNFTVELELDDETESLEIYIQYDDSRRVIELGSGMEKMISSIAIRVALINVSSLPKSDIFIIDEGFGSLDEMGVESCNKLLTTLKRFFRIVFVISHVDGIKDSADSFIELTRTENDSYVYVDKLE